MLLKGVESEQYGKQHVIKPLVEFCNLSLSVRKDWKEERTTGAYPALSVATIAGLATEREDWRTGRCPSSSKRCLLRDPTSGHAAKN